MFLHGHNLAITQLSLIVRSTPTNSMQALVSMCCIYEDKKKNLTNTQVIYYSVFCSQLAPANRFITQRNKHVIQDVKNNI